MTGSRRNIDLIVLHCSDSDYGDAALIDSWHRARGWSGIGYHYVIKNCYPDQESFRNGQPRFQMDGTVEEGRPLNKTGAHVKGYNRNSVGICLIGRRLFTGLQFRSLRILIKQIIDVHPDARLVGHYELLKAGDPPKSCPGVDMGWLRGEIG